LKVVYEVGDIVKVTRLDKYDDKLKRPLLVEFSSGQVKNVVSGQWDKSEIGERQIPGCRDIS